MEEKNREGVIQLEENTNYFNLKKKKAICYFVVKDGCLFKTIGLNYPPQIALLIVGVKESARFNNIFTGVNLLVVLYITLCGLFKVDTHNWNLSPDEVLIFFLFSMPI